MNKKLQVLLESLVAGILVFVLTLTNELGSLDYIVRDNLYQIPRGISSKIKIIGIDERTMNELGPNQTWSRSNYAMLMDKLNEHADAKPMIIGFDIQFSGQIDDGDQQFVDKVKESGNVVVVNHLLYDKKLVLKDGEYVPSVSDIEQPFTELEKNALTGYSNVAPDSDGVVRRIIPTEHYNEQKFSIFPLVIYEEYCKRMGISQSEIPIDRTGRSIINFSGKPGDYEYISFVDILNGNIDTRTFKDSIVLVGAYAPGMQDSFQVPNGGSQQMYGVEIHANILQSFIQNRFAINGNPIIFSLITAVIAAALHFVFRKKKIWKSLIILILVIAIEVVACIILNNIGYAFNVIYFPLVLVISYVYSIALGYVLERSRRKKVLSAFQKYVAPQIVEELSKSGDFNIKVGGENRDIAALFVDIRGFTTMSEALEPEEVVDILNEYLTMTTQAIFKNMGTLDKFVGDCTMAVFNSPFDLPDYEYKAVCAALDIVNDGKELQEKLLKKHGRTIGYGVGVNVGPAVVGNIGCDFRMDFTAIGDTVNTAARLEANAKAGQVLISDVLYERLKDRINVNGIGEIPLKGKSKGVYVYEVLSLKDTDSKEK